MTKTIKNITTVIAGEELNPISVKWDMEVECEQTEDRMSNETRYEDEERMVKCITRVELVLFDKYGIDVTNHFTGIGCSPSLRARLIEKLLDAVEFETIEELELQNA